MKKPLTFIALLVLFGTISWAYLAAAETDGQSKTEASKDDSKKDTAKGGEGEGGGKNKPPEDVSGGRFAGDPVYVHLAPMVLPVITSNGAEQIVTILIDVEVKDFDVADNMHANMPRVRDALMKALYGGLGNGDLRNGKLVNVAAIKKKATSAVASVVGNENVRDVLVQGIAQRIF